MRFVIYKGIIISVFCKGTFMSRALCETLFSRSFAECDLSEKCSPIPDSLGLLRHGTRCSDAGGGSADGGTFQLTLDSKSNWPHVSRWQLQWGSSAHCYLLGAFFTELPKILLLAFAFCALVWTTGLWGWAGATAGVLQFDYTIYSHFFGWVHYAVSCKEAQLLLLQKVKQIRHVSLPCCSTQPLMTAAYVAASQATRSSMHLLLLREQSPDCQYHHPHAL